MNHNGYIKAFSITEVLMSLVVSAVVVGITFVLFEVISGRMNDFKDQNQYIGDLNRLTYSINKDIFDTEKFEYKDHSLVFTSYTGNQKIYNIHNEGFIRRENDFVDTFKLSVNHLRIDTLTSPDQKVIYQRLRIEVAGGEDNFDFSFFKRIYSGMLSKKWNL